MLWNFDFNRSTKQLPAPTLLRSASCPQTGLVFYKGPTQKAIVGQTRVIQSTGRSRYTPAGLQYITMFNLQGTFLPDMLVDTKG